MALRDRVDAGRQVRHTLGHLRDSGNPNGHPRGWRLMIFLLASEVRAIVGAPRCAVLSDDARS
jgi:hypothetical protein